MIRKPLSIFAVLAVCGAFEGCGARGTAPAAGTGTGIAYVRVVNASPDIETVNPQLPPGSGACNFNSADPSIGPLISVNVDGSQAEASFPYGKISGYIAVAAAPAAITIVYPSATPNGCPNLTFTTPALAAGSYQTIAIAGQFLQKTLAFQTFADKPVSGGSAEFYNVSPATPAIDVGTFVPGQANFTQSATVAAGTTSPLAVAATAPGLGYYAGSGSNPVATIQPSDVDSYDAANVIPFNSESTFSIFLMDPNTPAGATVPKLAGRFN